MKIDKKEFTTFFPVQKETELSGKKGKSTSFIIREKDDKL